MVDTVLNYPLAPVQPCSQPRSQARMQPDRRASLRALLGCAALGCGVPANASEGQPRPVVLTVSGQLATARQADYDMPALAALPQHTLTSSTPWYSQPRQFTGPLLRDLLSAAGAQGQRLRMTALNDYRVELPREDADRYHVIVARLLDGQPMTVRQKGPLFVMYPFSDHAELRGALHYSRAIWQLRLIEVL